jgi:hypothetical protein
MGVKLRQKKEAHIAFWEAKVGYDGFLDEEGFWEGKKGGFSGFFNIL